MARTQTFSNAEVGADIRNKINSLADWTGSYSYNTYDITHYNGSIYASLVDSNLGNNPSTSAQWRNLTLTASLATSASYVPNLYPQTVQVSASWASASLSSQTSSYALVAEVVLNASTMVSVSYSSASLNADTASYVPDLYPQTVQVSASYAAYADSAPTVGLTATRSFTESGSAQTNTVHILNGLIIDWFQV